MIRHIKRNILKKRSGTNKIKEHWKALQATKREKEKYLAELQKAE